MAAKPTTFQPPWPFTSTSPTSSPTCSCCWAFSAATANKVCPEHSGGPCLPPPSANRQGPCTCMALFSWPSPPRRRFLCRLPPPAQQALQAHQAHGHPYWHVGEPGSGAHGFLQQRHGHPEQQHGLNI